MLRGLYTATAGMIAQQRRHDTITNNISNINTPGFKQGNAVARSFPEMMVTLMESQQKGGAKTPIGRLNTGVLAEEDLSLYAQGDLMETKNPYDFALVSNITRVGNQEYAFDKSGKFVTPEGERIFQPQAFFTVQNENGEERFSRNGKFTVNEQGQLITPEGYKVIGRNGNPIVLQDENGVFLSNAKLTPDGKFVDAVNGQPLMRNGQQLELLISKVNNPNRLIREGNGVYRINPNEENQVQAVNGNDQVQVHQGFIERSNVDPTQSMVDLMAALRSYETNQKMVQYYDKSLEKTVNEVGRV